MDGQHQYEINLKKDDLFISLSSDDVYFISKQMDKWFSILLDDTYVPVSIPQRPPAEAVVPNQTQSPLPVAEEQPSITMPTATSNDQLAQQLMMQSAQNVMPAPQTALPSFVSQQAAAFPPQETPQPMVAAMAMPAQPSLQPAPAVDLPVMAQPSIAQTAQPQVSMPAQPQVMEPVMTTVPEIQTAPMAQPIQAPQPQMSEQTMVLQASPQPQPVVAGLPSQASGDGQDDFEAVMNSLLRDFEEKPVENLRNTPQFSVEADEDTQPAIEPDLSGITSLGDLCERSRAANSEDYLLLSAYYLTRLERMDAFSLKKVNSILVKSGLTPVNHSVLETVLTNGFLNMVPDLTGTAEVTEYQISQEGLEAALALL
jgi:hypothetical protein